MTVQQALELARRLKPRDDTVFDDGTLVQFLNEIEGKIQTEVLKIAPADCVQYDAQTDLTHELLVGPPHDKLYYTYLMAMIDFANGEYDKYSNSITICNQSVSEWAKWFARTYCGGQCTDPGVYLSAYGIAVKHGEAFKEDGTLMTEKEWISLYGQAVDAANEAADAANTAAESLPQYVAAAERAQAGAEAAQAGAEAAQAGAEAAASEAAVSATAAAASAAEAAEAAAQTAEAAAGDFATRTELNAAKQEAISSATAASRPATWTPTAEEVGAIPAEEKGAAGGVATLGADGRVPDAQLPAMSCEASAHAGQHAAGGSDPVTPASIGAAQAATYTAAVTTTWTADSTNGGYTQTAAVSGMLATDNPIADIVLGSDVTANTAALDAWALITRITTAADSITLYANGDAPATAFTLQLKVVR